MPTQIDRSNLNSFSHALKDRAADFLVRLSDEDIERLSSYYGLLLKWNSRLHLVAPCSAAQFATRHILESLLLLRHLPRNARIADVGSGAGLPVIPCLIMRDDLRATLIESSQRKAVFLREALRALPNSESANVIVGRFEDTVFPEADFVSCRAIDRFQQLLPTLVAWASPLTTFLLFAGEALQPRIEGMLSSVQAEHIPASEQRLLFIAKGTRLEPKQSAERESI